MTHSVVKRQMGAVQQPTSGMVARPANVEHQPISQDFEHVATLVMDSFQVDKLCTKCGEWRIDHPWHSCTDPVWAV
jgi:hypothetical protein